MAPRGDHHQLRPAFVPLTTGVITDDGFPECTPRAWANKLVDQLDKANEVAGG